ncbi:MULTISPECIES: alpha/beta hydrolase [Thermomonospora]|uniref:Alpha-beta hydrolase superfamily lysophospholipase n=1 Tax=Thermomonospora cellulosilytica TaxID=1411118 RepID=A0A7W3MY68_9ACTN|nr:MULTISPECIES: alpha/beta hydrolase [Thermomonospora]MBA9004046.1 alpha-beta hydrolase superfamily lysophospholipase [Thermomonospora cellulosilytica]
MDVSVDVLGPEYEAIVLPMGEDSEGEVVATLVRRRATDPCRRAVLYVHGFVDYFFQKHLADFYVERGFDFYALDLRKYGRSLLPHQTPNFIHSISEYFAEIDEAVRIIREEDGHDVLLVNAHSTGGLTTSLWADRVRGRGLVQGLFLNSPFFDMNIPAPVRIAGDVFSRTLRARWPKAKLPAPPAGIYVRSLHRDHDGEWEFDLEWKPMFGFPVRAAWLAAIRRAHARVHAGLEIDVPVLVMASTRSARGRAAAEAVSVADVVLDVDHIVRWAPKLGPHVTLVRIKDGVHDLVLSNKEARDQVFTELDRWIRGYLPEPPSV